MAVFSVTLPLLLLILSVSSPYINGNLVRDIECSVVVLNMATCLSFVTTGSQVDKPDASCCPGLKTVLDTKAECLCVGLKNSASMGIKVNVTKAATLPAVCRLNAPTTTSCSLSTNSHASVAGSPSASALAPTPHSNHGCSLLPTSGLSFAISGALVILFSRI